MPIPVAGTAYDPTTIQDLIVAITALIAALTALVKALHTDRTVKGSDKTGSSGS